MSTWSHSNHPISDLRDWQNVGRLELRPDFQRRLVWSTAARVMLIDTIIKKIPIPKILVASVIKQENTHRIIIDGQQRVRAILDYLNNEYVLKAPYSGEYLGCTFSQLPENVQSDFLRYSIDYNEVNDFTEENLREVYSRFNKYTFALNKQELRRADFPGDFLDIAQEYSINEYLDEINLFTIANRKRMGDVEYTSELIVGLLDGPQDKKNSLDNYYLSLMSWDENEKQKTILRIDNVIEDLKYIFNSESFPLGQTRFRQKADFYSLFLSIDYFQKYGYSIVGKDISDLLEDLKLLDYHIAPSSDISDFRAYAERCVSDANSSNTRKWRIAFISSILAGTYINELPKNKSAELYVRIRDELSLGDGMCQTETIACPYCNTEEAYGSTKKVLLLAWPPKAKSFQISNSVWIHADCHKKKNTWLAIEDVTSESLDRKNVEIDFNFGQESFDY